MLLAAHGPRQFMLPNLTRLEVPGSSSAILSQLQYSLKDKVKELFSISFGASNLSNLKSLTIEIPYTVNDGFGIEGEDILKLTNLTDLEIPYKGSFREVLPRLVNLNSLTLNRIYESNFINYRVDSLSTLTNLRTLNLVRMDYYHCNLLDPSKIPLSLKKVILKEEGNFQRLYKEELETNGVIVELKPLN